MGDEKNNRQTCRLRLSLRTDISSLACKLFSTRRLFLAIIDATEMTEDFWNGWETLDGPCAGDARGHRTHGRGPVTRRCQDAARTARAWGRPPREVRVAPSEGWACRAGPPLRAFIALCV